MLHRPQRGIFTITERGRKALAQIQKRQAQNQQLKNQDLLNKKFLMQYEEFAAFQRRGNSQGTNQVDESPETDSGTPPERIEQAYSETVNRVTDELLEKILAESPEFFEKLVVQLLVSMGYGGSVKQAGSHLGG